MERYVGIRGLGKLQDRKVIKCDHYLKGGIISKKERLCGLTIHFEGNVYLDIRVKDDRDVLVTEWKED